MKLVTRRPLVLTQADLQAIWEAAIRVVRRVPLRCQGTAEFYDYLTDFGCTVEGELVRFPEAVVDKVVARIEAHRDQARSARGLAPGTWTQQVAGVDQSGEGLAPADAEIPSRLHCHASGQGLHCCDLETDRLRPATVQDLADFSRVVDAIPDLGRQHPTFIPTDVPVTCADLVAFGTIALHSSRPYRVSVYNADHLERFYEIDVLARGGDEEAVRRSQTFACKMWFNSPFMISRENVEVAMTARRLWGRPLDIGIMPVAGSSTPVTMAGCLVHQTAETIVCNTISLAVDERLTGYLGGALATDMKTGVFTQSGPDVDLLQLASAQMAEYVFGGRGTVSRGPTTTATVPGAQSMMEKSIATLFAILGGTRSFGSLAVLATADVGSVVQLMLDVEMMRYFQRLLDGVEVDAERLAEEVICEVTPHGARFLEHEHTLKYYREELFSPELADRRVALAWAADPVTMVDRARAKARRLTAEAPNCCPLSDADQRRIRTILDEACRAAG